MRVEQYVCQASGDWLLHEATDLEETIRLPSVDCELKLAEVYNGLEPGLLENRKEHA